MIIILIIGAIEEGERDVVQRDGRGASADRADDVEVRVLHDEIVADVVVRRRPDAHAAQPHLAAAVVLVERVREVAEERDRGQHGGDVSVREDNGG